MFCSDWLLWVLTWLLGPVAGLNLFFLLGCGTIA